MALSSPFLWVPIIRFLASLQLQKIMQALAYNFIIVAMNAWRGKCNTNRHAVALSDNFFYTSAIS